MSRSDLLKVFLRADDELAAEVRRDVIEHLFPLSHHQVDVRVDAGVVTVSGEVRDSALIPLAARLARRRRGGCRVRAHRPGQPARP
ncbi:BON domain-containing protein [Streptomyces sp. NPDC079020]|uniref:BON domain-containing protein n=1 Tax=Streptomyces sp. NPDC079020 TaxID=3365722 RepID=UPI0037CDD62E